MILAAENRPCNAKVQFIVRTHTVRLPASLAGFNTTQIDIDEEQASANTVTLLDHDLLNTL